MAKVTLGEVAKEARETCKGDRNGFPTVGLEHITPGEIRLSDCDEGSNNTFTKRFHEGDILFGRRRAYLKKAAIAPFEGICSGDITVIRVMQDKMEPRLLPFIIQNDDFFNFAVGRSAGSLSPRVKWEHLKTYSFELPEMDKQRELADVLWAIEDTRAAYQELVAATEELVKSRFVEMFGDLRTNPYGWDIQTFDKLTDLITDGEHNTPQRSKNGIFLLSARNILNHHIQLDDVDYIDKEEYNRISRRIIPRKGDVLISCSGTVGRCCSVSTDLKFQMVRSVALLRFKPVFNPLFAEYMITSKYVQEQINSSKTASSQANLFQSKIAKLKGVLPPLALQNEFAAFVKQTDKSKFDPLGRSNSCLMKTILRKK